MSADAPDAGAVSVPSRRASMRGVPVSASMSTTACGPSRRSSARWSASAYALAGSASAASTVPTSSLTV